ncbi:HTH-type transcriptional regulator DmlR [Rhizobium rhizogenes]|uniref:HTH-type transcriptional regulator TtuA n=1 Tax=Rhizobium rhizogenes TaxID=359 RepID=A0AAN2A3G7_RHIRH|nr:MULTISPECIES: LysR substrate-binding domain-containing protein [Rhizobium/Agrobacterium group]AQS60868.1 LysR family transcriptional regulator [Rhizobium rhizogenes]MCZ7445200.1 LysR substrate-binding domain-containing protein [Rhizobium rhizogenes]NSZ80011.1 LysR family transcriptional regulator [Agrobacterium tumefaciens]OAM64113.1 LysR family transcriptional regulator [Rhizobium rhizogenes]CAD0213201.1 HTH-type transcriptional regulator DmlR [Rhizobium rhizogenes]
MRNLNDLYYFVQIVDHGGFAPAARAVGLQKSKLSRRLCVLEDRLGVRLLNRSSRRFSVTEVGQEYYRHCVAMLTQADAAEQAVAEFHAEPRGVVRMACPVGLLQFQFGAIVARFARAHPAVEVHLKSFNRPVDVIAEGFDLAIRASFPPLNDTGLVMRKLDDSHQCLVASPRLISGEVNTPADLHSLPSLEQGQSRPAYQWELENHEGQTVRVSHNPRIVTDDLTTLHLAATDGLGVVQLPTSLVWQDVKAGRLIHLLPNWRPRSAIVHAVFASRRGLLPSVRALLDFLAQECALERGITDQALRS